MFTSCRNLLVEKLREVGLKTRPITTRKEIERSAESHLGAVLFESDDFLRNGSKRLMKDNSGATVKRRKLFDRTMAFSVIISDYKAEVTSEMTERFLASLPLGITIDGNYVVLEIETVDWVDDEDSILRSKLAAQIKIRFMGGLYRDTGFGKVHKLDIKDVKRNF